MDEDNTGHAHYAPESAAWLMQNIYNIYQYYPDEELLRERIYPMLKETALFFSHPEILVDDPVSSRKVMAPSYSSEREIGLSLSNMLYRPLHWKISLNIGLFILYVLTVSAYLLLCDNAVYSNVILY